MVNAPKVALCIPNAAPPLGSVFLSGLDGGVTVCRLTLETTALPASVRMVVNASCLELKARGQLRTASVPWGD